MSDKALSTLEEKLKGIGVLVGKFYGYDIKIQLNDEAIKQITQAFIADGWRHLPSEDELKPLLDEGLAEKLMTGREWHDKFKQELANEKLATPVPKIRAILKDVEFHYDAIHRAAKKAAGISL